MTAWTIGLNQQATYWPPTGNDGLGNPTYGSPVLILCRWQVKTELFRDIDSREFVSQAVVYPDRELEARGLLALGDHSGAEPVSEYDVDPRPSALALEIRHSWASPALHSDLTLYKVYL